MTKEEVEKMIDDSVHFFAYIVSVQQEERKKLEKRVEILEDLEKQIQADYSLLTGKFIGQQMRIDQLERRIEVLEKEGEK